MADATNSASKDHFAPDELAQRQRVLRRLDRLARLMDSRFRIPILGYRIGWDGLLGLVPVVGDTISLAISAYIIVEARKLDIPTSTTVRMVGNVLLDYLVGTIPVLGDFFDIAFKANQRNLRLLGLGVRGEG